MTDSKTQASQMRFNAGKPLLSYVFCNAQALARLQDYAENHVWGTESVVDPLNSIAEYLSRDSQYLSCALFEIVELLQQDCDGKPAQSPDSFEALLLCKEAWDAFCAVCERGAKKYARGNYRKGAGVTEYLDSACRHLRVRLGGEPIDPETGCFHLAHALWNVFQAMDQPSCRDDRLDAVAGESPELPEPLTCFPSREVILPEMRRCRRCAGLLVALEDQVCAICIARGEVT